MGRLLKLIFVLSLSKAFVHSRYIRALTCRVQALFNSLGDEVKGKTIGLGGDGRYFNKDAAQIIIKLAAAAGIKKVDFHRGRQAANFERWSLPDLL